MTVEDLKVFMTVSWPTSKAVRDVIREQGLILRSDIKDEISTAIIKIRNLELDDGSLYLGGVKG